jgi:predicted PurR-regulated permease PerM
METEQLRKLALILWTSIGVILLGAVLIHAAVRIRFIWLPIVLAVGVAIILAPLVRWLTNRGWPRVVATLFAFMVSGAFLVGFGALVLPAVGGQAAEFSSDLPELLAAVLTWIEGTAESLGYDVGEIWNEAALAEWLAETENQETVQRLLATLGAGAGRLIFGVTGFALALLLAPVLAFYILVDLSRIRATALELTPPDHRVEVAFIGREVGTAMGAFVRGQLVIAFLVAVMSSVGMWAIDLPFWLIVGIVAGVTNLVPFVGPILGSALGVLIALLNGSLTQALLALVIFVVIQQIESQILTPVVQRTMVKMAPVVVLIAIIVGGVLAGILGVLLAVPLSVAVRIVAGHLWRTRVLGQSWEEASASMIELTDPPDIRLPGRADESKEFETSDQGAADESLSPGDQPGQRSQRRRGAAGQEH